MRIVEGRVLKDDVLHACLFDLVCYMNVMCPSSDERAIDCKLYCVNREDGLSVTVVGNGEYGFGNSPEDMRFFMASLGTCVERIRATGFHLKNERLYEMFDRNGHLELKEVRHG